MICRDFPDVFHSGFEADAADYASQLKDSASDPALIGYFLMNEPTWGFLSELPAAGMLYTNEGCATRDELAKWLRAKHDGDQALAKAWNRPAAFEKAARGRWTPPLTKEAFAGLRQFSVVMVERYFRALSGACKKADPNRLNLGMRWAGVPPEWAVEGMKTFDVFSINCYMDSLPRDRSDRIEKMLNMPVMVGEWRFGAHDVGLPASGIGRVRNQADRSRAYRFYLEDSTSKTRRRIRTALASTGSRCTTSRRSAASTARTTISASLISVTIRMTKSAPAQSQVMSGCTAWPRAG